MFMSFELSHQQCPEADLLDTKSLLPTLLKKRISILDYIKERNKYKIWLLKDYIGKELYVDCTNCGSPGLQAARDIQSRAGEVESAQRGRYSRTSTWRRPQTSGSETPGFVPWLHYLLAMYSWKGYYVLSSFSFPILKSQGCSKD